MRTPIVALLVGILTLPVARAADVDSGPEKGAAIPALKVHDCTGDNKGKEVDHAAVRKDRLTVYLLINAEKFDRPMNRFMKTLDQKVKAGLPDVVMVAVWLTDDDEKTRAFLPRVQMSVQYEATTLTSFKGKAGPKGWNINEDAHLTVVIARKGKVAARYGYRSVNDTDVPAVFKELGKK